MRIAASSCMPGITCEYTSIVIVVEECPSRSLTTFTCSPLASASDADVWHRSRVRRAARQPLSAGAGTVPLRAFPDEPANRAPS